MLIYVVFNVDLEFTPIHEQITAQFQRDLERQSLVCDAALMSFLQAHPEFNEAIDCLPAQERNLFSVYSLHYPHPQQCVGDEQHGVAVAYTCGLNHGYFYQGRFEGQPLYDELYEAIERDFIHVSYEKGELKAS